MLFLLWYVVILPRGHVVYSSPKNLIKLVVFGKELSNEFSQNIGKLVYKAESIICKCIHRQLYIFIVLIWGSFFNIKRNPTTTHWTSWCTQNTLVCSRPLLHQETGLRKWKHVHMYPAGQPWVPNLQIGILPALELLSIYSSINPFFSFLLVPDNARRA